ncbi:MAG: ATP-binding protein, partial [Planctomycetes bacterium]|nr:ATP-binding protein [Planctomycetota bacterium]
AKLAYAAEQSGALALLCGPAGVGKTTVLRHVAATGLPGLPSIRLSTWADLINPDASGLHDGSCCDQASPDVLLVDNAHRATAADLVGLVERWRSRHAAIVIVLAGEGRLLSLAAGDARLEQSVRLRITVPPFSLAESHRLLASRFPGAAAGEDHDALIRTIHEIAGGLPTLALRVADIAAMLADSEPQRGLVPDDIETIHRRLCLRAA